jgi:hypothetical protein
MTNPVAIPERVNGVTGLALEGVFRHAPGALLEELS